MGGKYSIGTKQVAVICATKDRPDKVRALLESLAKLSSLPGQILIADGGQNLKSMVSKYSARLPISCLYCPDPGQVLQRNYAHSRLDKNIRLVLHVDDDITLEPNSLDLALEHWNQNSLDDGKPLVGMGLNVINLPQKKDNLLRKIALMRVEPKGEVWKSGYTSPSLPILSERKGVVETKWLVGGAAIWSREILTVHHPLSIPTRWAVCEDVIFSYPLSKVNRLVVCREAIEFHGDNYSHHGVKKRFFYVFSEVLMRYFFVKSNDELSLLAFFWASSFHFFGFVFRGCSGELRSFGSAFGMAFGFAWIFMSFVRRRSIISMLQELASRDHQSETT